jgi:hypothetical protein
MKSARYPSLYQINTRVWLTKLSQGFGRRATLDDIADAHLDRLAEMGFDWIWLLSVWQTGAAARQVSRSNPEWRREFQETLPDLKDEDIPGSGFAITGYTAHDDLGGENALARLRERLGKRGLKLMLDFVPNHMGLGHPWIEEHPEHFVRGTELELAQAPTNYIWVKGKSGDLLLAHGRDPYFPGWPDTLQINYGNPDTQEAMIEILKKIAGQCDGVRCDMAMLVLPEVFQRTWGVSTQPFWPMATRRVRDSHPDFRFMAEVYWDLEWTLQQQGFDFTYDKRLYDRLRDGHARPVREHFHASLDYQDKMARFLENHDEPRAAATFPRPIHEATAVVTFLSPGLRFLHQGQLQGRIKRISPHLNRCPDEPIDAELAKFYDKLVTILRRPVLRNGQWQLLECVPAWDGNWTWDCFIAFAWHGVEGEQLLVVVNYAPNQSQCRIRIPFDDLGRHQWGLHDLLSDDVYDRDGNDMQANGLFVDMRGWQAVVYRMSHMNART